MEDQKYRNINIHTARKTVKELHEPMAETDLVKPHDNQILSVA